MDNSALYCTSEDLIESINSSTTFCIVTGKIIATVSKHARVYLHASHTLKFVILYRGRILLLPPSNCRVLVLSCIDSLLEDQIPIPLSVIPGG